MYRLLLLLLAAAAAAAAAESGRSRRQAGCKDYLNRPGSCGTIEQCPALQALVTKGITSEKVGYLQRSTCGFNGVKPLLCCASAAPPTQPPSGGSSGGEFTGSPERHPNVAILNRGGTCGNVFAQRILGGTEVPLGGYPWVAVIGYTKARSREVQFKCGGALISQQHVVTAAHCVAGLGIYRLHSVRLGEHDLNSAIDCRVQSDGNTLCNSPQEFRVVRTVVHDDYDRPKHANDIALIKLERPVREDQFVGRVCLPLAARWRQPLQASTRLTAAGFGRTGPRPGEDSSNVLLEVQLPAVQRQTCAAVYRDRVTIGDGQLCAGGESGRDSCGGDSGGPLVAASRFGPPYTLVGLVSFGPKTCGTAAMPSVNTRVRKYLNWILDRLDA